MSTTFTPCPADKFAEIAKTWLDHTWPISAAEASKIYENLGYSADPEDPEMFASPFSDGKSDSYYVTVKGFVSTVDIAVARPCNTGEEEEASAAIADTYTTYSRIIDRQYASTISSTRSRDHSKAWFFTTGLELNISIWNRSLSMRIRSPYMTQLRREEEEMGDRKSTRLNSSHN